MFVDWKCVICNKMQIMDIFANVKLSCEFLRSAALQLSDLSEVFPIQHSRPIGPIEAAPKFDPSADQGELLLS